MYYCGLTVNHANPHTRECMHTLDKQYLNITIHLSLQLLLQLSVRYQHNEYTRRVYHTYLYSLILIYRYCSFIIIMPK